MARILENKILIGECTFTPQVGSLEKGDTINRLENRASALLEFLCQQPSQVRSHNEIIEQVWGGRFISPNSVAVVISDIRRALGDDVRSPTYIETLPKRGYRVIAEVTQPLDTKIETGNINAVIHLPVFRKPANLIGVMLFLILTTAFIFTGVSKYDKATQSLPVFVRPVVNETNDQQFTALATAVSELLTVEVSQHDNLQVKPEPKAKLLVSGSLILWDGHPAIALHAISTSDGRTVWSGMASGPETLLPEQVRNEIIELAEQMALSD